MKTRVVYALRFASVKIEESSVAETDHFFSLAIDLMSLIPLGMLEDFMLIKQHKSRETNTPVMAISLGLRKD